MGKPASKRPKKKNPNEGIQRLQNVRGSVNAEHEAETNPSTSTSAEPEKNGISPPQDTTLRMTTNQSGRDSMILKKGGSPALSVSQEISGHTSPRAQSSSLAPEGFMNDTINARGFSRLSGLSGRPHLIYPGLILTCFKQSSEQLKLLPLVKQRLRSS